MKTAFLIVNYNDASTTIKLLENIKEYQVLDLIVVVDNASTDASYDQLKAYHDEKIHVIRSEKNGGYGSGVNFGSKYSIANLGHCKIVVSNSDIVINEEATIVSLLKHFPEDAGIVAPLIKEHTGYLKGWKNPTPWQDCLLNLLFVHRFLRKKLIYYPDAYYEQDLVAVDIVAGCFFIFDSQSLVNSGFYDEKVFLYYEENIMAKKLEAIHKKTYLYTKAEVFHNHSLSIDKSISKIRKYNELKKSQFYFQKYYNDAGLFAQLILKGTDELSYFFLKFVYLFK